MEVTSFGFHKSDASSKIVLYKLNKMRLFFFERSVVFDTYSPCFVTNVLNVRCETQIEVGNNALIPEVDNFW